ncbi:MAG: stage III sporulation AC/AD family protein [Oscillospiraceae bacterium]|nr:stage III sporulation AC/AD family protein [Oscillospiraceae bacterium]
MEIFKLIGFVLATLVFTTLLKQYAPTYAVLTAIAACTVLILYLAQLIYPVLQVVKKLSGLSAAADFSCVIKAIGIALLAQTASDICSDSGQQALAEKVTIVGKAGIVLVSLPLFESLLSILNKLLI